MKLFKVLVNGQNFKLILDGKTDRFGFYTTRFVTAASEKEAAELAVDLVRGDSWLQTATLNAVDDPPRLYADEIEEVEAVETEAGSGFTFYPAADDSAV